jgi:hypothetical protein
MPAISLYAGQISFYAGRISLYAGQISLYAGSHISCSSSAVVRLLAE